MVRMVTLPRILFSLTVIAGIAPFVVNCSSSDGESGSSDVSAVSETEMVDCNAIAGIAGLLPKDDSLSDLENIGRCSWVLGTGRTTENAKFAIKDKNGKPVTSGQGGTENLFGNMAKKNGTYEPMLQVFAAKSESDRAQRWKTLGTMNDPGCKAATKADQYGLYMDDCKDPYSAGAIGFRKFPNPAFNQGKWDAAKYTTDSTMEPPYLVGLTCGACHTAFNPAKPPADPAHPLWNNLVYTIGNQYFDEGALTMPTVKGKTDFKYHVLATQERGTSDTSRISTDHINNPNTINQIVNLASRPWHDEKLKAGQITFDLKDVDLVALNKMTFDQAAAALKPIKVQKDGEVHPVQSILKGGEDSVGPVGAILRVFVNIGMCSDQWLMHFDPVNGTTKQSPLAAEELYDACPSYNEMLARVPAVFLFLAKAAPIYLKDAPTGPSYVNASLTTHGADVFADNCAGCHSSKQPPAGQDAKTWFRSAVHQADFLDGNFLADDKSYPITEIGTNAARALHSNHMEGDIWSGPYASDSYRSRKWPGSIPMSNPYGDEMSFQGPDGGPGYYRTPTLINIWARAPLFHNKSLGLYNGDPSVKGRMAAFEDAANKLLNPSARPGTIKKTAVDSTLELGLLGLKLHVPAGTPVNLLANLDPTDLQTKLRLAGLSVSDFFGSHTDDVLGTSFDPTASSLFHGTVGNGLMEVSLCPDLVEDKGHTFGSSLSADDKKALIEYLKTL